MTKEELARAKEICEKATAGPWRTLQIARGWKFDILSDHSKFHITGIDPLDPSGEVNANFIAESRTLLPKAIAEIEELEKRVEQFQRALRKCAQAFDARQVMSFIESEAGGE